MPLQLHSVYSVRRRRRHETMTTVLLFVPHDTQMGLRRRRPRSFIVIPSEFQPREEFAEGGVTPVTTE